MRNAWSYLIGTVTSPEETFSALLEDPKPYSRVLGLLLVLLVPWGAAVAIWVYVEAIPWVPTFIKVPDEQYYLGELILGFPMFLLPMIMVAGTIHMLSRVFTQENTLEGFMPPFLFALNVPFFLFCIHDFAYAFLCLVHVMTPEQFRSMITQPGLLMYINILVGLGTFVWHIPLMTIAIKVSYKVTKGRALLLCILTVPIFHAWVWFFFR
jgi:hypothetical protein